MNAAPSLDDGETVSGKRAPQTSTSTRGSTPEVKPEPRSPARVQAPRAIVTDLVGDLEGDDEAPRYADLKHVLLRSEADSFVARLTFAARLPRRMPDEQTAMLTSIDTQRGDREVSIYAEVSSRGWRAHTDASSKFPGTLAVEGATVTMRVPHSLVGRKFDWYSHASWTRSSLVTTFYSFDFAPDDQKGKFPSRRVI
jgi:hypothetical protein